MKTYEKRIEPHDFKDICNETLRSILVFNQIEYKVGDTLKLNEHVIFKESGNFCLVKITHIKKVNLYNDRIAYLVSFSFRFQSVARPL